MRSSRYALSLALAAVLGIVGCGGGEPPSAPLAAPTPPAAPRAAPPAPASAKPAGRRVEPTDRVPVGCIAKWTSGTTGTFQCAAGGPNAAKVTVDKDSVRLDGICVNDPRLAAYTFGGGQTAPIEGSGGPAGRCVKVEGLQRLPETCTCVPPAGGECTPPTGGFTCIAAAHVPLGGG